MMTSGASATNSSAYLRLVSAPPPAQRISIRMLRPSVQPNCCNPPTNAFTRVGYSESFVEAGSSTPMRRIRSGCCACVVSGHTATEVPISVMKSRRLIASPGGSGQGQRNRSNQYTERCRIAAMSTVISGHLGRQTRNSLANFRNRRRCDLHHSLVGSYGSSCVSEQSSSHPVPVPRHSTLTSQGIAAKSPSRRSLFFCDNQCEPECTDHGVPNRLHAMSALPPYSRRKKSCPLYPRKRTYAVQLGMSAKGQ